MKCETQLNTSRRFLRWFCQMRCCGLPEHIIETKAGDFDLVVLEDHYRNAMVQMLRQANANAAYAKANWSREAIA